MGGDERTMTTSLTRKTLKRLCTRGNKVLATAGLAYVICGCASRPSQSTQYLTSSSETGWHVSSANDASVPKIAVGGVVQINDKQGDQVKRAIKEAGVEHEAIAKSITAALRSLHFDAIVRGGIQATVFCPSPDAPQVAAVGSEACALPDAIFLNDTNVVETVEVFSHLLLFLGQIERAKQPVESEWTVAGGYGGVAPILTLSGTTNYTFRVSVRLFDLPAKTKVIDVKSTMYDNAVWILMTFVPFVIVVDEAVMLQGMGDAIGRELGRRFQGRRTP